MLVVLHCRLVFLDRLEIFDAEHVCVFGKASMFGRLRNHVDDLHVSQGRIWTECRLKLDVSSRYYSFYRIHGVIAFLFGTLYDYLDRVCLDRVEELDWIANANTLTRVRFETKVNRGKISSMTRKLSSKTVPNAQHRKYLKQLANFGTIAAWRGATALMYLLQWSRDPNNDTIELPDSTKHLTILLRHILRIHSTWENNVDSATLVTSNVFTQASCDAFVEWRAEFKRELLQEGVSILVMPSHSKDTETRLD